MLFRLYDNLININNFQAFQVNFNAMDIQKLNV